MRIILSTSKRKANTISTTTPRLDPKYVLHWNSPNPKVSWDKQSSKFPGSRSSQNLFRHKGRQLCSLSAAQWPCPLSIKHLLRENTSVNTWPSSSWGIWPTDVYEDYKGTHYPLKVGPAAVLRRAPWQAHVVPSTWRTEATLRAFLSRKQCPTCSCHLAPYIRDFLHRW